MEQIKKYKKLWWEGNDLHAVSADDGKHIIFENAYLKSVETEKDPGIVKETNYTFVAEECGNENDD